jgi:hypothetical protein
MPSLAVLEGPNRGAVLRILPDLAVSLSTGRRAAGQVAEIAVRETLRTPDKATGVVLDTALSAPSALSSDDDTVGPSKVVRRVTR